MYNSSVYGSTFLPDAEPLQEIYNFFIKSRNHKGSVTMTSENKEILDRINVYAEKALADIDPQKTRISFQLEALKPVMQEIADEKGVSVEDIFILYMDLASEASVEAENQLQATLDENEGADFSKIANRLN